MLPGEGVGVGIIDTGIALGHWAFDRERVTEVNLDREDATESGFVISHGTSVASVIAAQPGAAPREFEDIGVRGVAPGVRLTVFAVADRGPEGPTEEEELGWFGSALSPEAGVDILNISFGSSYDLVSDYPDEAAVRGRYGRLMDLLAQGGREEPSLIVFAAGNDNGPCDPALAGAFGDPSQCVADPEISAFYGTPTGLFFAHAPGVDAALQVHGEALRGPRGLGGCIASRPRAGVVLEPVRDRSAVVYRRARGRCSGGVLRPRGPLPIPTRAASPVRTVVRSSFPAPRSRRLWWRAVLRC